jgi:tRNA nucleotidyltransferase (CCA-adding enzyme)
MVMFGIKPGKKVGEIKSAIEEAILSGDIGNNYDDAKEFLVKNKNLFF